MLYAYVYRHVCSFLCRYCHHKTDKLRKNETESTTLGILLIAIFLVKRTKLTEKRESTFYKLLTTLFLSSLLKRGISVASIMSQPGFWEWVPDSKRAGEDKATRERSWHRPRKEMTLIKSVVFISPFPKIERLENDLDSPPPFSSSTYLQKGEKRAQRFEWMERKKL